MLKMTTAETIRNIIRKSLSITQFFELLSILRQPFKKVVVTYDDGSSSEFGFINQDIIRIDRKLI